ncbi:hypothetical protein BRM3_08210 [Brachybacterium huguangmaarense]|uniref:Uncharacterized protein n=1 Tax=Brachybacterium huguangmaarense TaxID=1652028 RepID=A0ABY6FXQ5_9MICO|nr:hypothetical protein [Brachybacterium huguangmaarense]UYG15632.1 hypothetical protein BRM3_08210 [Brachybacterium huguangmaarense]
MRTYIINEGTQNARTKDDLSIEVEAERYENRNGYFEFITDEDGIVFSILASKVKTVRKK